MEATNAIYISPEVKIFLTEHAKPDSLLHWEYSELLNLILAMPADVESDQEYTDLFSQKMENALGISIGDHFETPIFCEESIEHWVADLWVSDNWYSRPDKIDVRDAVHIIRGAIQDDIEIPIGITPEAVEKEWNLCCDHMFIQEDDR